MTKNVYCVLNKETYFICTTLSLPKILQEAYWSQRALQSGKMAFIDLLHSMQYLDRIFGHRQLTIRQQVIVTSSYHCEKTPVVCCRNAQKKSRKLFKKKFKLTCNNTICMYTLIEIAIKGFIKRGCKFSASFLKKSLHTIAPSMSFYPDFISILS